MIRVERHDQSPRVTELVLDRPEQRNALTEQALEALTAQIRSLAADESVHAVVLRGEGRVFCAGFDLPACRDEPERLGRMLSTLSEACKALREMPQPVVCAAHSAAIAGGCALAVACDFVVTNIKAKIGYPVVSIGVSPAVSQPVLAQTVGEGRARERLLEPTLISGERAREIRLAHLCVDLPEDVTPRAQIEAKKLADKPPYALRRTKAWINECVGEPSDAALRASLALVGSDEQRELLTRVLDARKK